MTEGKKEGEGEQETNQVTADKNEIFMMFEVQKLLHMLCKLLLLLPVLIYLMCFLNINSDYLTDIVFVNLLWFLRL